MKNLLSFLGTELRFAIESIVLSLVLSIFFRHGSSYWESVLYGSLGWFAFLNIYGIISVIVYWARCKKDPVFKEMSIHGGIEWKTYKRFSVLFNLQHLCQSNPNLFEKTSRDMHCWNVTIGSVPPSPINGWYEFSPYPENTKIKYWLQYNGIGFTDEREAFRALKDNIERAIHLDTLTQGIIDHSQKFDSVFPTIEPPESLPPIGSEVSYTVLKHTDHGHFKTRKSFIVLLHKDEQSMLISEDAKARIMTFFEYSNIYTNPLMNCSVRTPN